MASILKVDTIQDQSGNNIINESGDTITIGASGDTITIPSGASITLTDGVSGDFKMNSGYGSVATAYGCRAWVDFNGTGTVAIRGSGNVSSITDNGTGDYTVNFSTAMPDTNYAPVGTVSRISAGGFYLIGDLKSRLTTSFRYVTGYLASFGATGTLADLDVNRMSVFR